MSMGQYWDKTAGPLQGCRTCKVSLAGGLELQSPQHHMGTESSVSAGLQWGKGRKGERGHQRDAPLLGDLSTFSPRNRPRHA